ncbi:MAG: CehA/McbA family metallohydrolase [Pseudomonadota bacterium]|nr:CehA/McbA family metallohydrolase [Pseudomonadota bacterium]
MPSSLLTLALLACRDPAAGPTSPPSLGVDPAVRAAEGEARAGAIAEGGESALFGGVTAEGRAGDIKLYNSRVQVVIQGPYEGNGYIDSGGGILDLDLVREEGTLGRDLVEDLFLSFDLSRLSHAASVEILADGSDGGPAIVQSRGTDVPWRFVQGLFERDEPIVDDLHLDIVTTYELAPDAYALSIVTTLTNTGDETVSFTPQAGSFASGEDLLPWAPDVGFLGPSSGAVDAAIFTGRQGEATFSTWAEGGLSISTLAALASDLGIFLADHPRVELLPGAVVTLARTLAITPDTATAEGLRRASSGEVLAAAVGTVRTNGAGVPGVRVHLVDDQDRVAGFAMTDGDGAWSAQLPLGEWSAYAVAASDDELLPLPAGAGRYGPFAALAVNQRQIDALTGLEHATPLAFATGRATPPPTAFSLAASGATVDLELAPAGGLRVELVDGAGVPLPGVVDLGWAAGAPPSSAVPEALRGPLGISSSGRAAWAWTASGTLEIDALPGTYTVSAGHSWRHGRASLAGVEVAEGEVTTVRLVLDEVVPRDGWLAVDPHLHGAPSFDGALPMEDRLVTCAATGVDLPVTTDHDAIVDYRSLATALDLDGRLLVVPGTEVTTLARGHFNLYPLDPAPLSAANGGAEPWWDTPADTQELFDRMRQIAGPDGVIQVNHPRTPGMFTVGDFQPETATPSVPDHWSWDFQTFELLNGGVDDLEDMRRDWFSLLDFGQLRVPIGASDSHYRYIPCGLARTDVFLGTTDVGTVSIEDVREALLAGHVVVASGTTLRATVTGSGAPGLPGDTLIGETMTIQATVRSPDWIQPGTLRVYVGGEVAIEEAMPAAATNGLWLAGSWTVQVPADSWIVVEVAGTVSQGATWRNATPYAATNAFFVDTAGDGWTSPRPWVSAE